VTAFWYRAVNGAGERAEGVVTSASRREALEHLLAEGWHVLDMRERGAEPAARTRTRLWPRRRVPLAALNRQLATLCGSGVPLVDSLDVLIAQTDDERLRAVLQDVLGSVKAGSSLSDAMGRHRGIFPEIMVSMVRVGEVSGKLDEVLARLADLFERQDEIRGEVRAALAYPLFVLGLGMLSAVVLVAFVIPRLVVMFEGVAERLPLPTRILCGIASLITGYWWALLLALVLLLVAVRVVTALPGFPLAWDRFKLRIPWGGQLIRQAAVGRFARALGTLVQADVPIVEALQVVQAAAGNAEVAGTIRDMARQVQEGDSLAGFMKSTGTFPPLLVQMVAVGEETGHVDHMLLRVAEAYDREAAATTKLMTSLLAPVLILCVALVVAFIIVALILPIFQLSAGIS